MRGRILLAGAALLAGAGLAGCARSVFPPGGPVDTTPPRVADLSPVDSSVQVPRDAAVELLFSESMDRVSVQGGIRTFPPAGRQNFDWSGRRLRISWEQPLAERTTYNFLLSGNARDARSVPLGCMVRILFSTGDSIDRGRISGVLRAKTLRRVGVPILAFSDTLGPRPDTTGLPASYAAETDTAGVYELSGLPPDRGFTIHAFYDQNTNSSIELDVDVIASYPGSIRLTPDRAQVDSVNIVAIDPRAPAILNGTIATIDSTARFRVEAFEVTDSTLFRRVERIGPGEFSIRVPAGTYRLKATRLPVPGTEEPAAPEIRRDTPIEAKPEEEYGPFDIDFGDLKRPEAPAAPSFEDEE